MSYYGEYYEGSEAARLLAMVPWFQGCSCVLDYGCGPGAFLELLRSAGTEAEGYDVDGDARRLAGEKGLTVHATEPDLTQYDGLYMGSVIEHLALEEATRILRAFRRGIVVIETADARFFEAARWMWLFREPRSFWDDYQHVKPYTPRGLERLLVACGYEVQGSYRLKDIRPLSEKLRQPIHLLREVGSRLLYVLYRIKHRFYTVARKR